MGRVARAWGTVGVVQSSIREKMLTEEKRGSSAAAHAEATPPADAAPAAAAAAPPAPPGGRAAALAARAALPGSGWQLPPVLVYPEGTTSAGGCLLTFRSGAFVGVRPPARMRCAACAQPTVAPGLLTGAGTRHPQNVPVLPMVIRYSTNAAFNLNWSSPHRRARGRLRRARVRGCAEPAARRAARAATFGARCAAGASAWMSSCCRCTCPRPQRRPTVRRGRRADLRCRLTRLTVAGRPEHAARVFCEAVRGEMAAALGWPALVGWSLKDGHQLL